MFVGNHPGVSQWFACVHEKRYAGADVCLHLVHKNVIYSRWLQRRVCAWDMKRRDGRMLNEEGRREGVDLSSRVMNDDWRRGVRKWAVVLYMRRGMEACTLVFVYMTKWYPDTPCGFPS